MYVVVSKVATLLVDHFWNFLGRPEGTDGQNQFGSFSDGFIMFFENMLVVTAKT